MSRIVKRTMKAAFLHLLFFNGPAPSGIYTLSLHDALPIYLWKHRGRVTRFHVDCRRVSCLAGAGGDAPGRTDRKSTRLNSSHSSISYAVFCLKKKTVMCCTTMMPSA